MNFPKPVLKEGQRNSSYVHVWHFEIKSERSIKFEIQIVSYHVFIPWDVCKLEVIGF